MVDLAVVRGDVGDLSQAQAVLVVAHAVALLIAPPGSPLSDIASLKRRTVGVAGGAANQKIVDVLAKEYDLAKAGVTFKNLAPDDAHRAIRLGSRRTSRGDSAYRKIPDAGARAVSAERQNPAGADPDRIPGAIAQNSRAYESFDVPKGTLRGAPPVPDDDLTTLRVSLYLVANKKLGNNLVSSLTKSLLAARRDLIGEQPILAQVSAPDTDPNATCRFIRGRRLLQRHHAKLPGSVGQRDLPHADDPWRSCNGTGGGLEVSRSGKAANQGNRAAFALHPGAQIRRRQKPGGGLSGIEDEIDEILRTQRAMASGGGENAMDLATLNVHTALATTLKITIARAMLATQRATQPMG